MLALLICCGCPPQKHSNPDASPPLPSSDAAEGPGPSDAAPEAAPLLDPGGEERNPADADVFATAAGPKETRDFTGGRSCPGVPNWVGLEPCQIADWVYASGLARGIRDPGLSRAAASNAARWRIAKETSSPIAGAPWATTPNRLENSEVLDVFACGEEVNTLVRAPAGKEPLASCSAEVVGSSSPKPQNCAAWINKVAWREGDSFIGVGIAKLTDRSLASQTAAGRALNEIARMRAVEFSPHGTTANPVRTGSVVEIDREEAECNGYLYLKLRAKPS